MELLAGYEGQHILDMMENNLIAMQINVFSINLAEFSQAAYSVISIAAIFAKKKKMRVVIPWTVTHLCVVPPDGHSLHFFIASIVW